MGWAKLEVSQLLCPIGQGCLIIFFSDTRNNICFNGCLLTNGKKEVEEEIGRGDRGRGRKRRGRRGRMERYEGKLEEEKKMKKRPLFSDQISVIWES